MRTATSSSRRILPSVLAVAAGVWLIGCGAEPAATAAPQTGSIRVTTATTGADIDADGYMVGMGSVDRAIGVNASEMFTNLPSGSHSATLSDLSANCSVAGSNPLSVSVTGGGTANAAFAVSCTALTGNIDVIVNSIGAGIPSSYGVEVDGGPVQSIAANGNFTISGLAVGDHVVELEVAAANCSVTGEKTRTITIPVATSVQTVETTYDVSCLSTSGNIEVRANSSGASMPGIFNVEVDGTAVGVVDAAGFPGTFPGFAVGDHVVELLVPANCTVTTTNPQTVTIPAAATVPTVPATFDVHCLSVHGNIEVTANSSGASMPGIYNVEVDGTAVGVVDAGGFPGTFPGFAVGDHVVELLVPANCTVTTTNPQTVTIPAAATVPTVTATFDVSCLSTHGNIEVTANSSGASMPGIYNVEVDGTAVGVVDAGGFPGTFPNFTVGAHVVELLVPANCTVTTTNPQTVTILAAGTVQTVSAAFDVACVSTTGNIEVTATSTGTNMPGIYNVEVDGTAVGVVDAGGFPGTFPNFTVGAHVVELLVPANCTVTTTNPLTVNIPAAATIETVPAVFAVSCT